MSKRKIINEGGIIGTGEGLVNQNSKEFKELQRLIKERSGEQGLITHTCFLLSAKEIKESGIYPL